MSQKQIVPNEDSEEDSMPLNRRKRPRGEKSKEPITPATISDAPATSSFLDRAKMRRGFAFNFDGSIPFYQDSEKAVELMKKASGFKDRMPEPLLEQDTFKDLSVSIARVMCLASQAFNQYEGKLSIVDKAKETQKLANNDLEKKASELAKINTELNEQISTLSQQLSEQKVNCTEKRIEEVFEENSRLTTKIADLEREIRSLKEESDMNRAILESKCDESFRRGKEEGMKEVRETGQRKLEKAKDTLSQYSIAFSKASNFGQAAAVARYSRSVFETGKAIPEAEVEELEKEQIRLQKIAEASSVQELEEDDFLL